MLNQFVVRGNVRHLFSCEQLLKLTRREPKQMSARASDTDGPHDARERLDHEINSERSVSPQQVDELDRYFKDDESSSILNDFTETYSIACKDSSNKWLDYQKSCYVYLFKGGGQPSSSLASFDLDGTIIKPKSNKRIPRSATDWTFFSAWTKIKTQQAIKENKSRFVIFTNQNGVGLKLVTLEEIQERIELVTKSLNIPCTVFVATEKDNFRKPATKMFHLFERCFNDLLKVNRELSFYCGDAVGYPTHSDADIKFAKALELKFITPDKFVRGVKAKFVDN